MNAYAFAHPFASHTFQHTNQCLQKRVQANARDSAGTGAKLDTTNLRKDRRASANKGFIKWRGPCVIETIVHLINLVRGDSEVP